MTTIVNTHVGICRGRKRIYFEGIKLQREGYEPGMRFNVEIIDNELSLNVNPDGKYKVSRRKHRTNGDELPVIDITAAEMSQLFNQNDKVRIVIKEGCVIVSAHHIGINSSRREERALKKLEAGEELSICSVCHGGGVLDSAIHHGFAHNKVFSSIAIAIEIESKYLESSLRNNSELWNEKSIVFESPIQDINMNNLDLGGEVDILVTGIPCTGASKSGMTKNKLKFAEDHTEAGAVFFHTLNVICKLNPCIILIENVPEYQSTASMSVIRSVLNSLGYVLQERILNSADFGCIENRKRLAVVAISKGIDTFDLEKVTAANVGTNPKIINDILEDIPDDSPRWKSFEYLTLKAERDQNAGKGFKRQLLTGEESKVGTIAKGYFKCRSTEPFLMHPNKPELSRLFTPLEHAKLKTVPSKIINGLSDTVSHEILGQGVAYNVFYLLARHLAFSLQMWRMSHWTAMKV